jgi:hypothetical protein
MTFTSEEHVPYDTLGFDRQFRRHAATFGRIPRFFPSVRRFPDCHPT